MIPLQMSITSLCICTTDITFMSKREERWTKLLHAASRPCQAAAPARPRLNSHAFPPPHFSHAPISQVNKWREKMSEKERTSSQTTFDEARIGTGGYECLIGRERRKSRKRDQRQASGGVNADQAESQLCVVISTPT